MFSEKKRNIEKRKEKKGCISMPRRSRETDRQTDREVSVCVCVCVCVLAVPYTLFYFIKIANI